MWNIYICDDDRQITEELSKYAASCGEGDLRIGTYTNEQSLIGDIEDGLIFPDIIFMDIKLIHSNGIVVAKKVLDMIPFCQIIFISGYDQYYLDVYEVDHIYFIRKPFRLRTVQKAMQRAISKLEDEKREVFSFFNNGKITVLPINRIMYFEKDRRKIAIYTNDGQRYEYYGKLESLPEKLGGSFIRCHNSYVVNLEKVSEFKHDKFLIGNDIEIPVSRMYYKATRASFMEYIEGLAK